MIPRRTYWHLEGQRRKPGAYDVATSRLLYYPGRGFEVPGSAAEWYQRYQSGSALTCGDWSAFRDPRELTYARYVEQQRDRETFVDGILRASDDGDQDRGLSAAWLEVLVRLLAPLRYPVHGLQMVAAYVASMAPEGRVVVTGLFQVGDEIRRVQRLAYRLRQLQLVHGALAGDGRNTWEKDAAWQPLRRLVEQLLVTYDWGEAFVALCLVVKPAFDELLAAIGRAGREAGDHVLHHLCFSFCEDGVWHRDWARALARVAIADRPENRQVVAGWAARWWPATEAAIAALAPVVSRHGGNAMTADAAAACRRLWSALELEVP